MENILCYLKKKLIKFLSIIKIFILLQTKQIILKKLNHDFKLIRDRMIVEVFDKKA